MVLIVFYGAIVTWPFAGGGPPTCDVQGEILGDVDYFNVDVSFENLSRTAPHQEFRLHTTDSQGNSTTNICAWFPLDDLPFCS